MLFFPRRLRIICFFIVTPWQIGVILTANYTFLNYLVLALGIFLLDDVFLARVVPQMTAAPATKVVCSCRCWDGSPDPSVNPEP